MCFLVSETAQPCRSLRTVHTNIMPASPTRSRFYPEVWSSILLRNVTSSYQTARCLKPDDSMNMKLVSSGKHLLHIWHCRHRSNIRVPSRNVTHSGSSPPRGSCSRALGSCHFNNKLSHTKQTFRLGGWGEPTQMLRRFEITYGMERVFSEADSR